MIDNQHSSQTVFLPRQFSLSSGILHRNGHSFSSSGPALRAASAGPSAVRPAGLVDHRDSSPDTNGVLRDASGEGERPRTAGWQDNAVLRTAPPTSSQPAPGTNGERRSVSDTGSARVQKSDDLEMRSSRLTLRVKPGVKSALAKIADKDDISLSEASAIGLEVYARAKIHDQEKALFMPRMQAMMRREIRSSDDRHIQFEIKNAIAAEQTRSIVIDLYKRLLAKEGLSQEQIGEKLRKHYRQARVTIFKKTPQYKAMLAEYWQSTDDNPDWQAGHTQSGHDADATEREAGTGKPCLPAGKPDA